MPATYEEFAAWVIHRFTVRESKTASHNVVYAGNYQRATFSHPRRASGESEQEFRARVHLWQMALPRANTFPEVLAIAYEALSREKAASERPASRLLALVQEFSLTASSLRAELKAKGVRHRWISGRPIVGGSRRGRRSKRKKCGITPEERLEARLRTAHSRFRGECPNFDHRFEMWFGLFLSECPKDADRYTRLETSYRGRMLHRAQTFESYHYMVAEDSFALARLYHEQSKFRQAEELYWRAWSICLGEANLAPQFRELLLRHLAIGIGQCRNKLSATSVPAYAGPRMFVRLR